MTALQKAEAILYELTKSEKAQLLQWIAAEVSGFFPGIEKTEGTCGGNARIMRSRVPVWSLVNSKKNGFSDNELLKQYPTLTLTDLQNAWTYFRANQKEIEAQIEENELD